MGFFIANYIMKLFEQIYKLSSKLSETERNPLSFISYDQAKEKGFQDKYDCLRNNQEWLHDEGLKDAKGIIAIDEKEDAIAGYAFATNKNNKIFSVYVFPEYRKQGIGSELVKSSISSLNGSWLEVEKTNKRAILFYKNLGFTISGLCTCYGDNSNNHKVPGYIMCI